MRFASFKSRPTIGHKRRTTANNCLLGEIGEARAKLSPRGKIFVHGEYWNAEGDGEIEAGEKVEVIGFDGMTLKVRRTSANKLAG